MTAIRSQSLHNTGFTLYKYSQACTTRFVHQANYYQYYHVSDPAPLSFRAYHSHDGQQHESQISCPGCHHLVPQQD
jgi:hypothetical protein